MSVLTPGFMIPHLRDRVGRVPLSGELVRTDADVFSSPSIRFSSDDILDRLNATAQKIVAVAKAQHVPMNVKALAWTGGEATLPADYQRLLYARVWRKVGATEAITTAAAPRLVNTLPGYVPTGPYVRCYQRPAHMADYLRPPTPSDPAYIAEDGPIVGLLDGDHVAFYVARPAPIAYADREDDTGDVHWGLTTRHLPALVYGSLSSYFGSDQINPEQRQTAGELSRFYRAWFYEALEPISIAALLNQSDDAETDTE